jgi:hypothetical protein
MYKSKNSAPKTSAITEANAAPEFPFQEIQNSEYQPVVENNINKNVMNEVKVSTLVRAMPIKKALNEYVMKANGNPKSRIPKKD